MARPQVLIFQEFSIVPTEITAPMRACVIGPNAQLHRYSDAEEKLDIAIGEYDFTQDQCHNWPHRTAGSKVDTASVRLFVDDALLMYYEDLVGEKSTITSVSGRTNRIASNNVSFKSNGTAYPRSAVFKDRDVQINDVVYLRGVYDPDDTCEEIEQWNAVRGFASVAVAAEVGDARVDDANQATVGATASIEQISGPTNCVAATVDGSGYDGLAGGQVTEEYTIEVVRSSISGCNAARLRVRSASGLDDADDVIPEPFGTPTPIGKNGLEVTFTNDGGPECSDSADSNDVAPTDFALGQIWTANVRMAFEKVLALSSGDYDGEVNDTYIIECTKGGVWADLPQITIRTAKGLDASGPIEITDSGLETPIGTHGVNVTLFGSGGGPSDLSVGADACAGLRKGDKWYIPVVSASTGAIRQLILKNDVPEKLRNLADLDLRLYIKDDIEVAQNRVDEPPLTNYYTEATQICVQEGMTAFHESWTQNGVGLSLPIKGGSMYVDYREWLEAAADGIADIGSDEELDAIPGPLDPRNPLKFGAAKAWANSGGTAVKILGIGDPADVDSWQAAATILDGRDDLYNYVPLSFNKAIIDIFVALAGAESAPSANNWKGVVCALQGKTQRTLVGANTNSGSPVLATLTDNPNASGTQYTLLTAEDGNFLTNGVDAGDLVPFLFTTDGFGNPDYTEFVVDEVLSEQTLLVTTGHTSAITEPQKVEVIHIMTPDEIKEDLIAQAGAFSNRRVVATWPDEAGNADVVSAGYFVSCAVAGLISGAAPHAPLSNVALSGYDDMSRSSGFFNIRQLEALCDGGVWVVAQERDGTVYNFKAVTTDTTDLNRNTESVRRNVDSISRYIYVQMKAFIGRSNISDRLIRLLRTRLQAILDNLEVSITDELGPQLISSSIRTLQRHPLLKDHVDVVIDMEVPAPLNTLAIHLVV